MSDTTQPAREADTHPETLARVRDAIMRHKGEWIQLRPATLRALLAQPAAKPSASEVYADYHDAVSGPVGSAAKPSELAESLRASIKAAVKSVDGEFDEDALVEKVIAALDRAAALPADVKELVERLLNNAEAAEAFGKSVMGETMRKAATALTSLAGAAEREREACAKEARDEANMWRGETAEEHKGRYATARNIEERIRARGPALPQGNQEETDGV